MKKITMLVISLLFVICFVSSVPCLAETTDSYEYLIIDYYQTPCGVADDEASAERTYDCTCFDVIITVKYDDEEDTSKTDVYVKILELSDKGVEKITMYMPLITTLCGEYSKVDSSHMIYVFENDSCFTYGDNDGDIELALNTSKNQYDISDECRTVDGWIYNWLDDCVDFGQMPTSMINNIKITAVNATDTDTTNGYNISNIRIN